MVGTVNPSSLTSAGAAFDARPSRDAQRPAESDGHTTRAAGGEERDPALAWRAARESARLALADLDLTLSAGNAAAALAAQIGDAARANDAALVASLLEEFRAGVSSAIEAGGSGAAGAVVRVQIEADAPPFEIAGLDLRVKAEAGERAAVQFTTSSGAASPDDAAAVARAADETLARIQAELTRLRGAAQRLETHDAFLAAAEGALAGGVRADLNAETARLLALQVRQGLVAGAGAIATANPESVLGLFARD
ncbi:MAG: hypothetical protein GC206_12170 [Alphaproteobacteria bacterium]|nr:hypothetical protein [Alphaproteobacteria bacterium]